MKTLSAIIIGLVCSMAIGTAHAAGPAMSVVFTSVAANGSLNVEFEETGVLSSCCLHTVTGTANAAINYQCTNGNGSMARSHGSLSIPVSGSGTFIDAGFGAYDGVLNMPLAFSNPCPNGQKLMYTVCYSNIVVTGASGDSASGANICGSVGK